MIQKMDTQVTVAVVFSKSQAKALPKWLIWEGKYYEIIKIGLHHSFRQGRTLYHVFSVESETLFFRLVLDTESLIWHLEEISDGLPD